MVRMNPSPTTVRQAFAFALLGCLIFSGAAKAQAPVDAGERLAAARCASCHASTEAIHAAVPLLEGQPQAYFLAQWREFRERRRTAPVMVNLAAELSERDVAALARYYAALVPPSAAPLTGNEPGRALAERLRCSGCHGPALQGTSLGAARLAGQKLRYTAWSLQLMRSGARPHGSGARPDPLLGALSNEEIESLAAHFASLR
jgi:cytochrome c553